MTYIVSCPTTLSTLIIDSVLDYDSSSGRTSNTHGDAIIQYCTNEKLNVQYILESHVHADHLTGAKYLKEKYPMAQTGIGANVTKVQQVFSEIFNYTEDDLKTDGSQFDILFQDDQEFNLGELNFKVLNTPGHTPACVCYVVGKGDAVFTGDSLFMPDFGTGEMRVDCGFTLHCG
jgi:glyoxylase-like metal-dependent hydrolase (beta-lactamase superfamily II)